MDRLPAELLCQIATLCGTSTQFQLRHVNRSLRDAVTPLAFEDFYLGWIPKHFRHLQKLAASPLAKHVRRLVINTEMLPLLQRDEWEKCLAYWVEEWTTGEIPYEYHEDNKICDDCGRGWRLHERKWDDYDEPEEVSHMLSYKYSKCMIDADWQDLRNLSRDQQLRSPWTAKVLEVAMVGFRSIRRLELIDKRGVHTAESNGTDSALNPVASCSPWKNTLLSPDNYEESMWIQFDSNSNPPLGKMNVTSAYALLHIVKALANRVRNEGPATAWSLTELSINTGHHVPLSKVFKHALRPPQLKGISSRTLSEDASAWLESLSRIDLSAGSEWFQYRESVATEIVLGLSKAKNLRHLVLDLRRADDREISFALDQLEQSPWPQLAHLRYSGAIYSDSLLKFSNLIAPSLRMLDLVEVDLDHPSVDPPQTRWDDTIRELQAMLHLEHAHVRSLQLVQRPYNVTFFASGSRSEMSRRVERFLTKREEHIPRQENWDFVATGSRYGPQRERELDGEQLNTLRDFWTGLAKTPTG